MNLRCSSLYQVREIGQTYLQVSLCRNEFVAAVQLALKELRFVMCQPVRENVPALAKSFPTFGTLERGFTRVTTLVCLVLVRKRATVLIKVELTVLLPFCEKLLPQPGNSHG